MSGVNVGNYRLVQLPIEADQNGDNEVVAAEGPNIVIAVHHLFLSANAAVTFDILAGSGGSDLVPSIKLGDTGGFEMGPWDKPLFIVPANTSLNFATNAANALYGTISYSLRPI